MTLTEFLLARIAEDETLAQKAYDTSHDWVARVSAYGTEVVGLSGKRVLAECEAKRRIVEYREQCERDRGEAPRDARDLFAARLLAFDATLRALALPYVDHPDYDETWRP